MQYTLSYKSWILKKKGSTSGATWVYLNFYVNSVSRTEQKSNVNRNGVIFIVLLKPAVLQDICLCSRSFSHVIGNPVSGVSEQWAACVKSWHFHLHFMVLLLHCYTSGVWRSEPHSHSNMCSRSEPILHADPDPDVRNLTTRVQMRRSRVYSAFNTQLLRADSDGWTLMHGSGSDFGSGSVSCCGRWVENIVSCQSYCVVF